MSKPTRLDYCQYLLSTPINYTLTHFADHCEAFSHDKINRYLAGDQLRPRHVWQAVKPHLEQTPEGYIIFDDTVVDKRHAKKIGLAKKTVFWQCPRDDKWHRYRHMCLRQSCVRPVLVD